MEWRRWSRRGKNEWKWDILSAFNTHTHTHVHTYVRVHAHALTHNLIAIHQPKWGKREFESWTKGCLRMKDFNEALGQPLNEQVKATNRKSWGRRLRIEMRGEKRRLFQGHPGSSYVGSYYHREMFMLRREPVPWILFQSKLLQWMTFHKHFDFLIIMKLGS